MPALRGHTAAYPVLRAGFEDALSQGAPQAVLRRVLPEMLRGLHAFAFHGLIRTAHAWESGHRGELASALATWAAWMAGRVHWVAEAPASTSLSWAELRRLALAQFDDHAIKLVHAGWQEDQRRPDPKWRTVAALVLKAPG